MATSLDRWITVQREALMAYARRWGAPPVALMNMASLANLARADGTGGAWTPLPGVDAGSAMAFRTEAEASLWVDPRSDSYVRYFRKFLETLCGVDASALTTTYDIDHLYNRERAINFGYAYVRMFPVRIGANRSHGAGYEKAITEADLGRRAKLMKLMDTVSMLKLNNALSPRVGGAFTPEQQEVIAKVAAALGISVREVEAEIDAMMSRAFA